MSVLSKIYKWDGEEWELIGTTSGTTYPTGFDVFDSGKIIFWRVDTYDTETDLTTTGDIWVFWLAPLLTWSYDFTLTGYNADLAAEAGWTPTGFLIDGNNLIPISGQEWQFIDGEWQWSAVQNIYGGGRYQNKTVVFSHKKIFIEEY